MGVEETFGHLDLDFDQVLEELRDLHARKGADYDRSDLRYANIRGSAEWGISPWISAMVRGTDKLKRIQKYAKEGNLKNESVEDSFLDLAVYICVALILWREEEKDALNQN